MHINPTFTFVTLAIAGFALAAPKDGSAIVALGKRQVGQNSNGDDRAETPSEVGPVQPDQGSQMDDLSDPTSQELERNNLEGIGNDADIERNDGPDDGLDDDDLDEETKQRIRDALAAWENIPTLPPDLLEVVDSQAQLEALAHVKSVSERTAKRVPVDQTLALMLMIKPFVSRARLRLITENTINQVEMMRRNGESVDALLEAKLAALDVKVLEEQMGDMVYFRHGIEGDPDFSIKPIPFVPMSPLSMLTQGQDRMLAIAKARAGLVQPDQLLSYLMQMDPYLSKKKAVTILRAALTDLSTTSANFHYLVMRPTMFQRAGNWFKGFFGNGGS